MLTEFKDKEGIYTNLSNEDYHRSSAFSRSDIKLFLKSPYKYWAEKISPERREKKITDAMIFGSAFHTLILEPHLFNDLYIEEPARVYLKDVGKIKYEAYKRQIKDLILSEKIQLSKENVDTLFDMKTALENHDEAWQLLSNGANETTLFWQDEESELLLKCRPDVLKERVIIDLKTCESASTLSYQRMMIDECYHIQGAMIQDACLKLKNHYISTVINICIEKKYPYEIGIKIISDEALEYGRKQYKDTLLKMKEALLTHKYKSYEPEIINLPNWIKNEIN